MSFFTARNRQNPFAVPRQRQREAAEAESTAEEETDAILADPVTMAAIAEVDAELIARAVPHDTRDASSDEIVDAPDISTYATGGIVELPAEIDEDSPTPALPDAEDVEREAPAVIEISAETQAKIDAVMNHVIPPVAGPVEAEASDEPKRGRGRPRPQETIDRDNAVHELLKAADETGVSKEALAISLDEKEQQVYSSLRQLSKEGRAETRYIKGHGYRWFAV